MRLIPQAYRIPESTPFLFTHRNISGTDTDIYFICNQSKARQEADVLFRVRDMQPELWDPMHGTVRKLEEFTQTSEGTLVPVTMDELESTFIVFRKKGKPKNRAVNFPDAKKRLG